VAAEQDRTHFLTFGAGDTWPNAARRLARQAEATGLFSNVTVETGDEIFYNWPEFTAHRAFIEANPRGWGYWIWKPFLIRSHMRKLKARDVLFYLDAGFEIVNRLALNRMLALTSRSGSFVLSSAKYASLNAIYWCKQDLLDKMQREFSIKRTNGIPTHSAGCIAFVKNQKNLSLAEDWYRIASSDAHLIHDTPSIAPQQALYFEHRGDQAIFNFLIAAYNMPIAGHFFDYDYRLDDVRRWPALLDRPFLALRNRSATSEIEKLLALRPSGWEKIKSRLLFWKQCRRGPTHLFADDLRREHPEIFS
jgi:hypothetical protein